MNRNYDFVIFGATGLTGYYCVKNLLKYNSTLDKKYTFAIAGRNKQKLEKVLVDVGNDLKQDVSDIQIIEADCGNKKSVLEMTQKCKVLMNVIGPYALYGHVVVESCVETYTHYVDISGEFQFSDSMQLEFFDAAKENKLYIINYCGFDSIPADLGILYLKDKNPEVEFTSFEGYINTKNAKGYSVNKGTFNSLTNAIFTSIDDKKYFEDLEKKNIEKLYSKRPMDNVKEKYGAFKYDKTDYTKKGFYIPFWPIDSRVSKRTQYMFYQNDENDKPVKFTEYVRVASFFHLIGVFIAISLLAAMCYFKFTRYLLQKYPKFFTLGVFSKTGPTKEQIENSSLEIFIVGKGVKKDDKKYKTSVTLQIKAPEIAYDATSIFLINSAITILKDLNSNQTNHGVITPGYAFRRTEYIKRLADFKIEWIDVKKE